MMMAIGIKLSLARYFRKRNIAECLRIGFVNKFDT